MQGGGPQRGPHLHTKRSGDDNGPTRWVGIQNRGDVNMRTRVIAIASALAALLAAGAAEFRVG